MIVRMVRTLVPTVLKLEKRQVLTIITLRNPTSTINSTEYNSAFSGLKVINGTGEKRTGAAIKPPATGIARITKLFLSTFGVPSARMRGREACTLKRTRRNAPQIRYMNDRNHASL